MSYDKALDYVRTWFGSEEQVTPEHVYEVAGRADKDEEANNTWLTNKLTHLKHYKLVDTVLTKERPARRSAIKLTPQGKKALAAPVGTDQDSEHVVSASELNDMIQDMEKRREALQEYLPALEVVFKIKVKDADL